MLTAELPLGLAASLESLGGFDPDAAASLSARYRSGKRRGPVARSAADVAAYAVTRLPATYAATSVALRELAARQPSLAPSTHLDLGAGTGAAVWAAAAIWGSACEPIALEAEPEMLGLGRLLTPAATWVQGVLPGSIPAGRFDLVTIGYVLNELDEEARRGTVERAWDVTAGALVVVEPGTPAGYATVLAARTLCLERGGTTVAPCPHDRPCPLDAPDWCHFAVRLPRTHSHRLAKDARRGHEDEKFSYAVIARAPAPQAKARVLRHPQVRPGHVRLQLSTPEGIREQTVSKRDGHLYRRARKVSWGDDLGQTI